MKIGIIAAESKEMNAIKKRMTNISEKTIFDMTFYIGDFYSHEIYLYDFDTTGIGDYEIGEICGIGRYFECDQSLVNKLNEKLNDIDKDYQVCVGKIGTADYFCSDHDKAAKIHEEFDVECVEMEGAAIAQVCYLDKIPFVVIRGISDTVKGDNKIDFHTYLEMAAEQVGRIIDELLKDWR